MSKLLTEAFSFERKKLYENVSDYDIFPDKELLEKLRNKIIENLVDQEIPEGKLLNQFINEEVNKAIEGYDLTNLQRSFLFNLIEDEINGFGPISELLNNKEITEIMVNGCNEVYIEIDGKITKDDSISFINNEHILRTIQRLIQPMGRTIDAATPMVDSRLKDGSRINAVIPPLSVTGPIMTIRKFRKDMTTIEDLIRIGTVTPVIGRFLEACVKAKLNIIICGGTGSGKTTFLNIICDFINDDERLITIEDAAELKLDKEHLVSLETRIDNYKVASGNSNEVTIRDLVINALRMRPDRIIVGEVRGKEAFDMLQAMNTGHDGSITTLHANGCQDALNRLETMVLMSGIDIPINAVREYMESAIDLVICIERQSDGRRKVVDISEVHGMDKDQIHLNKLFEFNQVGLLESGEVNGVFKQSTRKCNIIKKIRNRGIKEIDDLFE